MRIWNESEYCEWSLLGFADGLRVEVLVDWDDDGYYDSIESVFLKVNP